MNRLKELRTEKGLTQQELADVVDVTKLTIANWENEKHKIKSDKAQQLSDYFGVSVAFLLGFIDDRTENLIDYDTLDDELIQQGRELVKMFVSDKSLEQFEELHHKQSGLPPIFSDDSNGNIRQVDSSYIVHENLTHIYWLIAVAPREYQELIAKWGLLNYDEHDKIMGLVNLLIEAKIDK